ncbi:alpha/beta fold hydrolase [Neiella sp. HB171785]|uniref:Alpha/beta fold hydrolase n=1 Tax=Neiella litorisoli TaxID=2771431 RepID=A0A8J6QM76_9GAMM|nr:alpha/beta fold hydrolase [Neiella litorisoli]MBD1390987.1 alpha/beta fold hydrolase [Neiella litorisoli]
MAIQRLEVSDTAYSEANVSTITVNSSHIQGRCDISIYNSVASGKTDVPIVVLLHGVYGSHWVWMRLGGVHQVYQQLKAQGLGDFVLVMPSDGGLWEGSAYLPLPQGNFERWIVDDVIDTAVEHCQCVTTNSRVYLTGLSMGGYGTLRLGAKYPERFAGLSAHSSVTSLADLQQFVEYPVSDYQCADANEADLLHWFSRNRAKVAPLRMDCGEEDSLFASNMELSKHLSELNIEHEFSVYSGGHEWPYWNRHIATTLRFFNQLEQNQSK